jgi:aldose sugar dehydrogenase
VRNIIILFWVAFGMGRVQAQESFNFEVIERFGDVVWGFDFVNANEVLLTLRSGELIHYNIKTKIRTKVTGVPQVQAQGQGGLLDIRVAPWDTKRVFFTFSTTAINGESSTALAEAELNKGKLENVKTIIDTKSRSSDHIHFGSRIEFDAEKNIYLSIGDRNERSESQSLAQHNGKVLRITSDGKPVANNPFIKKSGALPEIFTFGHRNPQGLARHPESQRIWLTEMGPRGGDELNVLEAGQNYGWPLVTHGREYHGPAIGVRERKDTVSPVVFWVPSISPSAAHFYTGWQFPKWKNNLFIVTLSGRHLRRLVIEKDQVQSQDVYLEEKNERFRNVRTGLDGFLYLSTDSGIFARLVPK